MATIMLCSQVPAIAMILLGGAGIALTGLLAAQVGPGPVMAVGGMLTAGIAGVAMLAPWVRAQA